MRKSTVILEKLLFVCIIVSNCLMHFNFLLVSFFVMLLSLLFLIYFLTETGRYKQTRKNNVIYFSIGIMLFISIIASFSATNNDLLLIKILINIYSFAVLNISFFLSKAKIEVIKENKMKDASGILKIHGKSTLIVVNIVLSNGILYWFGFPNLLQKTYLMVYFAISFLIHVFLILKLDFSSKRLKIVFCFIFILCYLGSNSYQMYTRYLHTKPVISIFEIIVCQLINLPIYAYLSKLFRKCKFDNSIEEV